MTVSLLSSVLCNQPYFAVAMLRCSFRLSCEGHHFELAAACQREKETWVSSIRKSVAVSPTWINEPVSSLHIHGEPDRVSWVVEAGLAETMCSLPTIEPIPELTSDYGELSAPLPRHDKASYLLDTVIVSEPSSYHVSPSRRSSSA